MWPSNNGVPATLDVTGATLDLQYVNFQDIAFVTGGTNVDLSAVTGGSGDAGGNTITGGGTLTFSSPTTQHWLTNASGNWSDVTNWTSRIPLPQDQVAIDAAFTGSPTLTNDMEWTGRINASGGSGSVTLKAVVGAGGMCNVIGAFTGRSGVTLSSVGSGWYWNARAAVSYTASGTTNTAINNVSASNGGALTFADTTSLGSLQVRSGVVIIPGGVTLTTSTFTSNASNSSTPLDLRVSGTLALTASSGTIFNIVNAGAGLNIIGEYGGKISVTNTGSSAKTFAGNGNTFTTLWGPSGTGGVTITGANTFTGSGIQFPSGGKLTLPGSTTTTLNAAAAALVFGNGANTLPVVPSSGSATLSFGAAATPDYLNLTNTVAAGTTPVHAGAHSTDSGGNTNWLFP